MAKVTALSIHFRVAEMITMFLQQHVAGVIITSPFKTANVNYKSALTGEIDLYSNSRWCFCFAKGYEARMSIRAPGGPNTYFNVDSELFEKRELLNKDEVWQYLSSHVTTEESEQYHSGYFKFNSASRPDSFESLIAKYWDTNDEFAEELTAALTNRIKLAIGVPHTTSRSAALAAGARMKYDVITADDTTRYERTNGSYGYRKCSSVFWTIMYESALPVKMDVYNQTTEQAIGILSANNSDLIPAIGHGDTIGIWHLCTIDQVPGSGQSKVIVETIRAVMEEMRE